jgi:NADH-quinone oxidoreductase subunit L
MTTETLIWLVPLPPALAFFIIALFTYRERGFSHWVTILAGGLSWLLSMVIFVRAIGTRDLAENPFISSINWLPTGETWLRIGVQVDPLTTVTLFFVSWTILMIFIYSVGYHNYGQPEGSHDRPGLPPHGAMVHGHQVPSIEPMYSRFFAFFGLFAFGMYLLVVTDNLLVLFVGWEIMGLCSYLLIGFWYGKISARDAAVKAFMTTRVGDMFMMVGLVALYSITGSLNYREILANPALLEELAMTVSPVFNLSWAALIGILIFIGTVGKSAQFPLHVWLPDAMEGPTPVSAMIHAATMVSAGVYLSARFFPLISAGWIPGESLTTAMTAMAFIGAFTALFAATIALAQNDVKRVLAFSTISQLGYMIAALGIGAFGAGVFHLVTHAFFKALLFLGSGSVIHGMEHGVLHTGSHEVDSQNMLNMGGLKKKMPATFWTFLIGGLALSGFPLVTAGFWSKDEILSGAFNGGYLAVFLTLALAALLTAFYTSRLITLTFLGKPRTKEAEHAQESKPVMTLPLVILSMFAVGAGWVGIPESFPGLGSLVPNWFEQFLRGMLQEGEQVVVSHSAIPLLTSLVVSLGGLYLGWLVYRRVETQNDPLQRALGSIYKLLQNKYFIDEFYSRIFVRPSLWVAETLVYRWIDKGVIDGILHGAGYLGLWLGRTMRSLIDQPVINDGGDALANGTRGLGVSLRRFQTGRVQQYMVISILVALITGILFYIFIILA